MRKCAKCDTSFEDEVKFCPNCGAEWIDPKKKVSFGERRRSKEREKQEILDKAQLRQCDLDGVATCDPSLLNFKYLGALDKIFTKTILLFVASLVLFLACIACAIIMKMVKLNATVRVLLLMVAFMLGFCAIAMSMSKGYQLRLYKAMKTSAFAMKKLSYGKPPQLAINGQLFEVTISQNCPFCLQTTIMHIEEFEGNFVAVCDADRSHLLAINSTDLKTIAQSKYDSITPQK